MDLQSQSSYRPFLYSPKIPSCSLAIFSPPHTPHSCQADLFSVCIISPLTESHINGMIQYIVFCVWLLSLNVILLRIICNCTSSPILFIVMQYFTVPQLAMHSPVDRHQSCFQFEAQESLCGQFSLFWVNTQERGFWPCVRYVFTLIRNCQIFSQSDCVILYSYLCEFQLILCIFTSTRF